MCCKEKVYYSVREGKLRGVISIVRDRVIMNYFSSSFNVHKKINLCHSSQ